jgi:AcrR family transcriptional regulator
VSSASRRTFWNYFSSKEEALFHGDAEKLHRMLATCALGLPTRVPGRR